MAEDKARVRELSEPEQRLIELVRELNYGQMVITVRDGVPCHIDEIHKSIPLK